MKPIMVRSTAAWQAAALDQLEIEPRRREAGAAGDQQMRDARALGAELQALDRGLRQLGRVPLETAHAGGGVGKLIAPVEAVGVDVGTVRRRMRAEKRIAVLDAGTIRHALKQRGVAVVAELRLREAAEGLVNIVRRHGGGDAVDIGGGQRPSPGARVPRLQLRVAPSDMNTGGQTLPSQPGVHMDVTGGAIRRWRGPSRRELRSMARSGMVMRKVAPIVPCTKTISPPWARISSAAMARPRPAPPRGRALERLEQMRARLVGNARPGVGDLDHHHAAFAPAGDADLVARRIARAARLQRLHGVARDVDQHAEQLVVVGIDRQPALDRDDPADRHVERQAERLVHLLDQRLDLDGLALGRRLLRRAVGQRRLAERDGALERAHQLGREALHLGIGQARKLVGEQAAPRPADCADRD